MEYVRYPLMADDKQEIRLRMPIHVYEKMGACIAHLGFSNAAEFVRVAVKEKINRDCPEKNVQAEEICIFEDE